MKVVSLVLTVVTLALAGCLYDAPLVGENSIPIDSALLGVWEEVADDPDAMVESPERMLILPFSGTEYLVHYPVNDKGGYYRAYRFNLGGVDGVQLQFIGDPKGPVDDEDKFLVASYSIDADGNLVIKLLNDKLVEDELSGSEAIREAFLEHKDAKDLFTDPGTFKRVANGD